MIQNKHVYNIIVKLNDKETVPPAIDVPQASAALFDIYLALLNFTHSI
jgi:hypothetical protein